MLSEQVLELINIIIKNINMSNTNCYWHNIFDDATKEKFDSGTVFIASISAALSFWLLVTILFSNLRADLSYRNLSYFVLASFIRCSVAVLWNLPFFNGDTAEGDAIPCNFLGFWASFISVYEVECLTHVCIERYVVAKYNVNGWEIQKNHYTLYQILCVIFALAYALPPVFGMGKFGADFSCASCVLDMVLPETWDRYVVVIIYMLRSVKSTGFMIVMLVWARQGEARYISSKSLAKMSRFTQNVITVTAVNLFCWAPITVTRAWVILSFLIYNRVELAPSAYWVQWAMWIQWIAPAATVVAMFLFDDMLRIQMKALNTNKIESTKKE